MFLLIFSTLLWIGPIVSDADYIILIPDDCEEWEFRDYTAEMESHGFPKGIRFALSKESRYNQVSIVHFWMQEEEKLELIQKTYSEIQNSKVLYTSALEAADWLKFWRKDTPKLFLLLPEDYCSEKRFNFNHIFTLFEVKIERGGH